MGCANSSVISGEETVVISRTGEKSPQRRGSFSERPKPFREGSITDFAFIGKLGQGSFATVHKAQSSKVGDSAVAVKVTDLRDKSTANGDAELISEQQLDIMKEEVDILARVTGRTNVINFYGSFRDGCLSFFVMEHCDCSLMQAIDRLPAITEATMCRLLTEMLRGLASVHEVGIVHRDVKPDNFLCTGPESTVKLCDFGFASSLPHHGGGLTGAFGTPPFMSPEMLNGMHYGAKSDAWSFGVILYSLFYGRFPYEPSERSGKAMMNLIRTGVPVPSFCLRATIVSGQKVSDGAKALAVDLLKRNPDDRISAKDALRHHFFASPGKTSLAPMLESARSFGAFRATACSDLTQKSEVDHRLEALQREREEAGHIKALKAAATKLRDIATEDDGDCSTRVATNDTLGPCSPASTMQSFDLARGLVN